MNRTPRTILFTTLGIGIALIAYDLGQRGSAAYQRMLVTRVEQGLRVLDFDWARVEANGLRLSLRGHAPDTQAQALALESARATAPIARISNYMTATLAPPPVRDPVSVEMHRDRHGVLLTGQVAGPEMRARLLDLLGTQAPDVPVRDMTGTQAARIDGGAHDEIAVAVRALAGLPNAYVRITPGRVQVDGQVPDQKARRALEQSLVTLGGDRVLIEQNVRIPLSVIAPFAFVAVRELDGGLRIDACAVRSTDERQRLVHLLAPYDASVSDATCPVGLGGPLDDWPGAIGAGLAALATLKAGRFELDYRTARLTAYAPTSPLDFEATKALLDAGMPNGFSTRALVLGDDAAAEAEIGRGRYWLNLSAGPDGVAIAGQMPGEASRTALETYAGALFGSGQVTAALQVSAEAPPADWQTAAMALTALLARTGGTAELTGRSAILTAAVSGPEAAVALDRATREALGTYPVETRARVDLVRALAEQPLPPQRCAYLLTALVGATPLSFDPGSAVLSRESAAVLDQMARTLVPCRGGLIEIGGHTDSDGSDTFNLRLSHARARAVRDALAERGVRAGYLMARGYGETAPVGDNDTPAGRALNRRIAFRALGT